MSQRDYFVPAQYDRIVPGGTTNINLAAAPSKPLPRSGPPPRPPAGMVTIWTPEGAEITAVQMEEATGSLSVAQREQLEREGRTPVKRFSGVKLGEWTFTLRIEEGVTTKRRINDEWARLQALALPSGASGDAPAPVQIIGEIPFGSSQLLDIDSIDLTKRRYQPGSRTVLRYVQFTLAVSDASTAAAIARATPQRTRTLKGKRRERTIKTIDGQTLRTVAVVELGDSARWRDLRTWNKALAKVDPDVPLRAGTKVVIK